MASFFDRTDGVGLSAPQVGINVQLMVFNSAGERGEGQEIILVNPKVMKYSKKTLLFNEGCLSFPNIYADIQVLAAADSILLLSCSISCVILYGALSLLLTCLSFTYMIFFFQRPESLRVDAQDISGAKFAIELSGLPARVFQHEFDHLQVLSSV